MEVNYKETHATVKNLFYKDVLLKWKLLKQLRKHMQDAERLAEEL